MARCRQIQGSEPWLKSKIVLFATMFYCFFFVGDHDEFNHATNSEQIQYVYGPIDIADFQNHRCCRRVMNFFTKSKNTTKLLIEVIYYFNWSGSKSLTSNEGSFVDI
jgi:hypothetical protein